MLEIVDIKTPDDPTMSGRYVRVDDDLELIIKLVKEGRLIDLRSIDMQKAYMAAGMRGIDTEADVDWFFAELGLVSTDV
jgi:hypothetical protein